MPKNTDFGDAVCYHKIIIMGTKKADVLGIRFSVFIQFFLDLSGFTCKQVDHNYFTIKRNLGFVAA